MKHQKNITDLFPKHLFWDVDVSKLDVNLDSDIIIPRALYMTNKRSFTDDIVRLEQLYTSDQIIDQLRRTKEKISNEVCELVSERYHTASFYRFNPIHR